MKKWNMMLLTLALLLWPALCGAQELADLFTAVYSGMEEGLGNGIRQAMSGMEQELTLRIEPDGLRLEEGKPVTLHVVAGNPRPVDTPVSFALCLPERVTAEGGMTFEAVLPAAKADPQTGELVPSESRFSRQLVLQPGGGSEQTELVCEMGMGARFYRASAQLALCVSDISAEAVLVGAQDGRLHPGDEFAYEISVSNAGAAPKDVEIRLLMPDKMVLSDELPAGFSVKEGMICGQVHAKAATEGEQGGAASSSVIRVNARVDEEALREDDDAVCLLTGALRVDGERVPLPRVQVCGPKISAQLVTDKSRLRAGEQTQLRVVVVNAGLAPADVRLSLMLPDALMLAPQDEDGEHEGVAVQESAQPPHSGAVSAQMPGEAVSDAASPIHGKLVYDVRMPAAQQTENGIAAATQIIRLNVLAREEAQVPGEQLVGAALAWSVDTGETQMSEAVAMRLGRASLAGVSLRDWKNVMWVSVLLMLTIVCLYVALRPEKREQDYCCD